MKTLLLLSPAKINLTLQVLRKRKNSYHEIYTIFQKIDLFDEIEIKKGTRTFSLDFFCEIPVPLKENLVYKAYKKFKEKFNIKDEVQIKVKKIIPISAGLGGGSSNAATVLKGLAYIYGIETEKLYSLARDLGADVPFFLSPYFSAIGKGIGDQLIPFPNFSCWYILICPDLKISTKWAYENLKILKIKNPVFYTEDIPPWYQPQGLINDFKKLIFEKYSFLKKYEKILKNLGACAVGLSGTGPSIFGIFNNPPFQPFKILKTFFRQEKIFLVKNLE